MCDLGRVELGAPCTRCTRLKRECIPHERVSRVGVQKRRRKADNVDPMAAALTFAAGEVVAPQARWPVQAMDGEATAVAPMLTTEGQSRPNEDTMRLLSLTLEAAAGAVAVLDGTAVLSDINGISLALLMLLQQRDFSARAMLTHPSVY